MRQENVNTLLDFVGAYAYLKSIEKGERSGNIRIAENNYEKYLDKIVSTFGIELGTYQSDEFFNLMDKFTTTEDDSVEDFIDNVSKLSSK